MTYIAGTKFKELIKIFDHPASFELRGWASNEIDLAYNAYNGSLDAAFELQEILLSGWSVTHAWGNDKDGWSWCLTFRATGDDPAKYAQGKSDTQARSWTIAILKAYSIQILEEKI
jgi:hypothetical protein